MQPSATLTRLVGTVTVMSASRTFKSLFHLGRSEPAQAASQQPSPSASPHVSSPAKPKKGSAWNAMKTALKISKAPDEPRDDGKTVFQVGDCTFETPEAYVDHLCHL